MYNIKIFKLILIYAISYTQLLTFEQDVKSESVPIATERADLGVSKCEVISSGVLDSSTSGSEVEGPGELSTGSEVEGPGELSTGCSV